MTRLRVARALIALVPVIPLASPPALGDSRPPSRTLAVPAPASPTVGPSPGYAVVIGGALSSGNDAVWSRLVELAGGEGTRFVVLATASGDPERSASWIVDNLRRRGAVAEAIPVAPMIEGIDLEREVRDSRWIEKVRAARGVYFSGGWQERIVDTLAPGGEPTPLLEAIRDVQRSGGVIAGSSAGAAVMSATMIRDAEDVMGVMKGTIRAGKEISAGLGFAGDRLFTDQHFLRRGRIGRLLPVMLATGYERGLGVEENTAAVVHGNWVEVLGAGGVLYVDLAGATSDPSRGAFNLRGARLSFLDAGDRLNLASGAITPSAAKLAGTKLDWKAPGFAPSLDAVPYYLDVLGHWAVVLAMGDLVDSRASEVRGLAYDARSKAGDPFADLGFEFRLYKGEGTLAWYTDADGAPEYTIGDVHLDVEPVKVARPLFTSWPAR